MRCRDGGVEAELLRRGGIYTALAVLTVLAAAVAYERHRRAAQIQDLRFEEQSDEALTVLAIHS